MRIVYLFVCIVIVWRSGGVCSELFVYEEQPIGTSVGRPILDGHQFSFTTEQSQFEINTNTSEITTLIQFDTDSIDYSNISLEIRWSLLTPNNAVAYATLLILLLDINDNSPTFPTNGETVLFPELTPVGSDMELSRASDRDRGVNGTVTYSLTTALTEEMQNSDIPFVLDVTRLPAVFLLISAKLDYDTKRIYQLLLIASDGGTPPRKEEHSVIVQIIDANDQIPTFLSSNYSYSIPEGSALGTSLGRVQAIDTDSGSGGSVVYSLVGNNIPFSVAMDGLITVSEKIDFEINQRFEFQVRATNPIPLEGVTGSNYSSTYVSVEVTDINDNSPTLRFREGQSRLRLSLQEELRCPTTGISCQLIGQLKGTQDQRCVIEVGIVEDKDSGVNGEVTGVNLGPLGQEYFTPLICNSLRIMTFTAVFIYNKAPMDRENRTQFSFSMSLQDGGSPRLQTDWLLEIALTDVNDNTPVFGEETYGISVAENVTLGTSILTVTAVDRDLGVNGTVRYSIISFSPTEASAFLAIDTVAGEIRSTGPLDRESLGSEIRLRVSARDMGPTPLSSSCEVTITLTDINDNSPVFRQSHYSINVSEELAVGTVLITITADDIDQGFAGEVRYTMDANAIVAIGGVTGEVVLLTSLDYETSQTHEFSVTASDRALPQLASSVQLCIHVLDYNDNAPVFDITKLQGTVSEDATIGTIVLQLLATDRDSGTNGDIQYQLSTGQSVPFLVSESGVIATIESLDRETADIYTLSVVARDRALSNQLSGSATVSITVRDVDDNPPKFVYGNIVISFLTNQMVPLLIGPSIVTDEDSIPIQCSIPDQSKPFLVTSTDTSCNLYANQLSENKLTFQLHTQDTRQSLQSAISVDMRLLSAVTINNSLVIEINSLLQSQFLIGPYDSLLSAVSSNFKLHIWAFIPSPVNQSNLRVLLSASALEDGALLSADSLYSELATSLPAILPSINVTRISPCVGNTCIHGDCVDIVSVQPDSNSFVQNSSHLFNALNFSITSVCSCRQGYTGNSCERRINPCTEYTPCLNHGFCTFYPQQNNYVCFCQNLFTGRNCETSLSICASSPCTNGDCVDLGGTFRCVCPPGYTGERCEVYLGFCTPGSNPCRNGGTCVDGNNKFKCVCPQGFVGDTCETSSLCFKDTSYLQLGSKTLSALLSLPYKRADVEVSFDMRTSVYTGLIAYIQEGETFLILELINSSIHYIARSTQEADATDFVEIYPTVNVSDGKWHSVTLKSYIHSGFASLTIDDNEPHSGAQTDSLNQLGLIRQATLATEIDLPLISVPLTIGGLTNYLSELSPYGNLNIALSGVDTYASFLLGNTSLLDYTGAIRNLSVNGMLVALTDATSSRQVESSEDKRGECKLDPSCTLSAPCSGHGSCIELYTDHICVCDKGYTGRDCQIVSVPITLRGKGAISFQLTNLTLETHLRTVSDWLVINRTVYREYGFGLREWREEEQDRVPQTHFYGRVLDPPQSLEVQFITRNDNGVILTTRDTVNYAILEVSSGQPRFRLGRHLSPRATYIDTTAPVTVTNASLFRINVTLTGEGVNLFVESQKGNASHWTELTNQIPWLVSNAPVQLVLGGKWDTALNRYTDSSQHFTGCVSGLTVAGIELPIHQPIRELGVISELMGEVQSGCDDFGTCGATSCPLGTTCVPVWAGIRCECELGEEYDTSTQRCEELDDCLDSLATCHNGGVCLDARDSYTCICSVMYTGANCSEINAVTLMIILIVLVLFVSLIALPFILWILFRFVTNSNGKAEISMPKQKMHSSMSQTGTNTYHPFKQIKDKTGQLMQNIRTNLAPKNSPVSLPIRTLSPPLANYPQTNQMLELQQTEPAVHYPTNRKAHTFPSANIPSHHHGNTMPSRMYRAYSPPIANPIEPQDTHSIPGRRLIRSFNIYDV